MDEVTDPIYYAGEDEATLKLVQKLAGDDLLHKSKTHVKSPTNMLSSAKSQTNPVKSQTKKLSSALKNLESVFDDPFESRKRKSIKTTSFRLPSAKTSSSSTSKKTSKKNTIKKTPLSPKGLQAIVNGKDIKVGGQRVTLFQRTPQCTSGTCG
eukprot:scaffold59910_cov67-Attheya_sp.AAC.1